MPPTIQKPSPVPAAVQVRPLSYGLTCLLPVLMRLLSARVVREALAQLAVRMAAQPRSPACSQHRGKGGVKSGVSNTAGGAGGTAAAGDIRINGGTGSDGQTGSSLLTGNGGASYFGGGGRAGSQAGIAGAAPGSGGGGAYDLGFTSTAYTGGDGADGILIPKNSRNGLPPARPSM